MNYEFTSDWFSSRIPVWERHLVPHCAGRPVQLLEVGSHEGRSAIWTMQHLATHPAGRLLCIDVWEDPECRRRFDHNVALAGEAHRVTAVAGDAGVLLRQLGFVERGRLLPQFDHVYLDADHRAHTSGLGFAALVWPLLKPGGLLTWDDYELPKQEVEGPGLPLKPGIDAFCTIWAHELEIVHTGWQRIIRKRG